MKKYQPVNCAFHDYLEHFATLKQGITIVYKQGDELMTLSNKIITNLSGGRNGEYLHFFEAGVEQKIRLDDLISVGGIQLSDFSESACATH